MISQGEYIFAIDPGTFESAYVLIEYPSLRPVKFDKIPNDDMIKEIESISSRYMLRISAVEKVASYGMSVGQETFDTAEWVGQFKRTLIVNGEDPVMIYRRQERLNICGSMRANDTTVKQALIDRFAYGVPNRGKGTKAQPGFFYGFRADVWQAFAIAVTAFDMRKENGS